MERLLTEYIAQFQYSINIYFIFIIILQQSVISDLDSRMKQENDTPMDLASTADKQIILGMIEKNIGMSKSIIVS